MKTVFPLIATDDPTGLATFYIDMFGFEAVAELGWYVHLAHPTNPEQQVATIEAGHDSLPQAFAPRPGGVMITFECDDADALYQQAVARALPIHVELQDEAWGQRHFITQDPSGTFLDVAQPIEPSPEFLAQMALDTDNG